MAGLRGALSAYIRSVHDELAYFSWASSAARARSFSAKLTGFEGEV